MSVTPEQDDWMLDKVIRLQQHRHQEYQILDQIGRGSFGALYLGQSLDDNAYVAIKVVRNNTAPNEYQELEVDIQASLHHPNILALHGTTADPDHTYMVMDLCDLGDLFDHLAHCKLTAAQVTAMFGQVLDAVSYMHRHNVYHRDLKLENILLYGNDDAADDQQQWSIKVADFGLSTRERYNTERGCGSTIYLAPEHFFDHAIIDSAASDVWSLGILLIYMVFRCHLWQEASDKDATYCQYVQDPAVLKDVLPELSQDLYHFLITVLAPNPADRPSVEELQDRFTSIESYYDDDDKECWPLKIVTCGGIGGGHQNQFYKANPLQDSAVFSDSEISEQQQQQQQQQHDLFKQPSTSEFTVNDDQEETMFVHQHESSWWL